MFGNSCAFKTRDTVLKGFKGMRKKSYHYFLALPDNEI